MRHHRPNLLRLVLASLLALGSRCAALAVADGAPDPGFNGIGRTVVDVGANAHLRAVATYPDGKVVVAGEAQFPTADDPTNTAFVLVRWNADGTRDTTFGSAHTGVVVLEFDVGPIGRRKDGATSLAIQPDGMLLVAGYAQGAIGQSSAAVARLTRLGNLDLDFGNGAGKITLPQLGYVASCTVHLRRSGAIVLTPMRSAADQLVAQLTSLGALDPTFGVGGMSERWSCGDIGCGMFFDAIELPDGGLVAIGYRGIGLVVLVRFQGSSGHAGEIDRSFGYEGEAGYAPDGISAPYPVGIELDHAGRLVVFIVDAAAPWLTAIGRLVGDRSDPTFGDGSGSVGWANFTFLPPGSAAGLGDPFTFQLQPDGKPIIAGTALVGGTWNFAATRLTSDGTAVDSTFFGGWSSVPFDVGGNGYDEADAIASSAGRIVLAGYAQADDGRKFAVARLDNATLSSDGFESGTTWFWETTSP